MSPLPVQPLLDVQQSPDARGVALQQVGVRSVSFPLTILQRDGQPQSVSAKVSLAVDLPASEKGTHLSRFILHLTDSQSQQPFCYELQDFLTGLQDKLGSQSAFAELGFPYFIPKAAPVSGLTAPMSYDCGFYGHVTPTETAFVLRVSIPVATLCPCSKAISDYGAHNQRALITASLRIDPQADSPVLWFEDVIEQLEKAASCPVYPVVKREDEKWMTEAAYDNPQFVEDVLRDAILICRQWPGVTGFSLTVEAFESIHAHNAWAQHHEGLPVPTML